MLLRIFSRGIKVNSFPILQFLRFVFRPDYFLLLIIHFVTCFKSKVIGIYSEPTDNEVMNE